MINENLDNILDDLFYKDKLGVGNKTSFIIICVRDKHPVIKVKDRKEYLKNQEVSQMSTTVNKKYEYKITHPTYASNRYILAEEKQIITTHIITS
jgi:hypothetical protein